MGRIAGIPIRMHLTLLILLAWIAATYAITGAGLSATALGVALVLAIFVVIVVHELGHALVARRYGILIEEDHVALRGLFIIDPAGVLQYAVIHSLNIGRSTEETRRVLNALQTGGLCPSDWKPGGKTLQIPEGRKRAA